MDNVHAVGAARIAAGDFVQQVSGFPLGPHIIAETVISQTNRNSEPQHTFNVGGADSIVHIAAWLVRHPGVGLAQKVHFGRVYVNGVSDNTFTAQYSGFGQTVDNPFAVMVKGVIFIGFVFGDMDVETGVEFFNG